MSVAAPTRTGPALQAWETLDAELRAWAEARGAREHRFPALLPAADLRRAEYPQAFPHLLMAPAVAADPGEPLSAGNVALPEWFLSPAVCYHVYARLAGMVLPEGVTISATGTCFRHECAAELRPGRRQVEFTMREMVLVGTPEWLEARLRTLRPEVQALATARGWSTTWQPANDPFFLPRARGKAHLQRLLGTKEELCAPDGLALASINRHAAFFGERFDIRLVGGAPAHTACVAWGLDRWAGGEVLSAQCSVSNDERAP